MKYTSSWQRLWSRSWAHVLLIAVLLWCLDGQSSILANDPQKNWIVIQSDHFSLVVDAQQKQLGTHYLGALERAWMQLKLRFIQVPEKITVVLNDHTDLTNGFAAPLPYPYMNLNPALPSIQEGLGEYGDWSYEFVVHELTHIVNFSEVGGVMRPLRNIFGTIIAPNILLPTWWKEGIAVEMESNLSTNGRSRSQYQQAFRRALSEDGKWDRFSLPSANEAIPNFPFGNTPYFAGSLFFSYAFKDHPEKAGALNRRHGERVPYFIEEPAREIFGHSYLTTYEKAIETAQEQDRDQLAVIHKTEVSPYHPLQGLNGKSFGAQVSPDGSMLAFLDQSEFDRNVLRVIKRDHTSQSFTEGKFLQLKDPPEGRIQRLSWLPDSKAIIFDFVDEVSRYQESSDLMKYDLSTQEIERLTTGMRLREPFVEADGKSVLVIRIDQGKTALGVFNLNQKEYRNIYISGFDERLSWPVRLDENTILVGKRWWDAGKSMVHEQLFSVKEQVNLPTIVSPFLQDNSQLATVAGGELYFVSDRTGVRNIYSLAVDKTKHAPDGAHQIARSNVTTGVWSFTLDRFANEIWATRMSSDGPQLVRMPLHQVPIQNLPIVANSYGVSPVSRSNDLIHQQDFSVQSDYGPAEYLWPQYWFPFINASTENSGTVIEVITSSADPLNMHSYTLDASYDSGLERMNFKGSYLNQVTRLPWGLGYWGRSYTLGASSQIIRRDEFDLTLFPDVFFVSPYLKVALGVSNTRHTVSGVNTSDSIDALARLTYSNFNSGLRRLMSDGWGAYLWYQKYLDEVRLGGVVLQGDHYFWRFDYSKQFSETRAVLGEESQTYATYYETPEPQHILRGFASGSLFGNELVTTNLEYRFLLANLFRGSGTDPYYLRRLSAAVVADFGAASGYFYDSREKLFMRSGLADRYGSVGFELRLASSLGYVLPVQWVLGTYQQIKATGINERSGSLSIQIKGL